MSDYKPIRVPFDCTGVDVCHPADRMQPGRFPFLQNARSELEGTLTGRPGYEAPLNSTPFDQTDVHSIRRMNNDLPGFFPPSTLFVGAGTKLYSVEEGLIDSGYSGDPISLVTWRPDQSVEPWMYVGDSLRMRKSRMDTAKTNYQIGITPPTAFPFVQLDQPLYTLVDEFNAAGAWTPGGVAAAPVGGQRDPGGTIVGILDYNVDPGFGQQGWCNVSPSNPSGNYSWIGVGARLEIGSETVTVQEVHTRLSQSTILGIDFDTPGGPGLCTIQAATPLIGLARNSMVQLGGGEVPYCLSVTIGPDGLYSFRCFTVSAHAVGETLVIIPSFRVFFQAAHAVNEPITAVDISCTITPTTGTGASGIGTLTRTIALDLSSAGGRPLAPEDYMHLSIWVDNPANLIEGRLLLDVDPSVNNFTQNYYYVAFRPADSTPALDSSQTSLQALQTAAQNLLIGDVLAAVPTPTFQDSADPTLGTSTPNTVVPDSEQLFAGNNTWTELLFPYTSLQRVGAAVTRNLANVQAIQIYLNCSGPVNIKLSAWWVGGSYGPDVTLPTAQPYLYRYRYRSSITGAKSQQSPGTRANILVTPDGTVTGLSNGAIAYRQQILVYPFLSSDPQVDQIDIERFGGVLNEWHYVGTVPNNGSPVLKDPYADDDIKTNPPLETDCVLPFPSFDAPINGTCNVVGTSVRWVSGPQFNVTWAPGQEILINGIAYIVYGQPASATHLFLTENAGVLNNVPFQVAEPTLTGEPMAHLIGPFADNFLLSWGDPRNPGVIRATKGNDPDSAPIEYYLELASPSEPILGGVIFDDNAVVASSRRFWRISIDAQALATGNGNVLVKQELNVGHGLFAEWVICQGGGQIFFLGEDGVPYVTQGSQAVSLIEDDLRPLFPHDGEPGVAANSYYPPDLTLPSRLRFAFTEDSLRFDYKDTNGSRRTLIYNPVRKGWQPWVYAVAMNTGYWEEGEALETELLLGQDGHVYPVGGFSDNGTAINGAITTPTVNGGNPRTNKQWGDEWLDVDPFGLYTIQQQIGFNFGYNLSPAVAVAPGKYGRQSIPLDISGGAGALDPNAQLLLTWSQTTASPVFYEWQAWAVEKGEVTGLRAADWDDAGYMGDKWVQGVIIRGDTAYGTRNVNVLGDTGAVKANINVKLNGEDEEPYSFNPPFTSHLLKLAPTDSGSWSVYGVRWVYEPLPELVTNWITIPTSFGLRGWFHARDGYLPLWSQGPGTVQLIVSVDNVPLAPFEINVDGTFQKYRIDFPPNKGKLYKWSLTSTVPVRVFKPDIEIRVKPWGSTGPYQTVKPLGDVEGQTGAKI